MQTYREGFESAIGSALSGATVLTANTRSARAVISGAEARLRAGAEAWLTPDVLPFGAFIERLYTEAVVNGAIASVALQREQELQLWRKIIERSPQGRELLLLDSAAASAREAFRTACEYEIDLGSAQMSASSDTRAFSAWAAEFRRQLAERRWSCAALFARELRACLRSLRLPQAICLYISDCTPAQRRLVDALAEAGVALTDLSGDLSCGGRNPTSSLRYEFAGEEEELRGAAQWVRQQLTTSADARVGIVLFDLESRHSQVERIFRAVLHPEHMLGEQGEELFEIASPPAMDEYPVVASALGVLSLMAAPVAFDEFQATLCSPYIAASAEAAARFVRWARAHARKQVSSDEIARWAHKASDAAELRAALSRLPKHEAFASEQPVAYWVRVAREILQAFGWPGVALDSREFQATQSWSELLDEIATLEALHWRCDFRAFVLRLRRMAANRGFKPESRNAPVQIMDAAESEGSLFECLWIGGCSDHRWPDAPRLSPLLPVALLKAAGAPVPSTPRDDERIARTTRRLLQAAPRVVLSLALRADDESEQQWSPLFQNVARAGESIAVAPLPGERFPQLSLEAIRDCAAPPLHGSEQVRGGTWLLQEQSNCPFRAFAIRRLLAAQEQGPSEALAATERGKVIERALQLIWEQLQNSDGLADPNRGAIVAAAVDDAMRLELPHREDEWTVRFHQLERQRTIDVIEQWLEAEMERRKPFEVVAHQLPVELELAGLQLRGRLDRLDKVGDAHVVIDYKTGAADSVSSWRVPRPEKPQLPLYALALLEKNLDVAGISFASVRRGECAFRAYLRQEELLPSTRLRRSSFDAIPFDNYVRLWAEELERIAVSFVQGEAAVDPRVAFGKTKSPCTRCHLLSLCRVQDAHQDPADEATEESHE